MLFNSAEFLIFFPLVVCLYFACPPRYRWALLLAASYYFYAAWKAEYLILILASTVVDYFAGLQMANQPLRAHRTKYLVLSLLTNLGLLFTFKYFNFFNESLRAVFNTFNIFYDVPAFQVLLPVGISFYTFQTLSYTIDVYRGKLEPERNFGIFALYVAFFPQLVAGPIERAFQLLPQFHQEHIFDAERVVSGLRLMMWGMFKKVVIADRLAVYVDAVYNNPTDYHGWPILIATYFFAFQIYCDFSGYSDIAIGAARVMGYNLMDNFRQPYFSQTIAEFWRRWHISLSTWFRDYLYIPLGGNRTTAWRWYVNLFVVFVVSGLWHGASWTFVVWGALHGGYLLLTIWTQPARQSLLQAVGLDRRPTVHHLLAVFVTFHLVCLAWLFFRANTVNEAFLLLQNVTQFSQSSDLLAPWATSLSNPYQEMLLSIGLILLLEGSHLIQVNNLTDRLFFRQPVTLRWAVYLGLSLAILNLGVTQEVPFIYFQF